VKYLLPILGLIATAAWLTSHGAARIPAPHKYAAAVAIILACIIVGALIDRAFKPKPQAAPPRAPFSQYRQYRQN
jgi:hypothetical protein